MSNLAMWGLVIPLVLVHALLAAVGAALDGVSDVRVKELAQAGSVRAQRVLRLRAIPELGRASLNMGLVLSVCTAAAFGVLGTPDFLVSWFKWSYERPLLSILAPVVSALLVGVVTITADLIARSAAVKNPERAALLLSRIGAVAFGLFSPFVRGGLRLLNIVLRPIGADVSLQSAAPPLEELEKQLIRQVQRDDLDQGAPALIRSIFELSEKTCSDVMVPRTDVVGIDSSTTISSILTLISEENHSRIPVFEKDIDHIIGVLHVRDLVPMLENQGLIVLEDLLRPVVFVPWLKGIGDLLRDMQRQRIHMAMVVDEYGGFAGIVTLEDILREIVGPIQDEFEVVERQVEKQSDDSFLVDASLPITDFARAFDFRFPPGEFETLGGFLAHLAGSIPDAAQRFVLNGWTFVVQSKDGARIDRVRVYKPRAA